MPSIKQLLLSCAVGLGAAVLYLPPQAHAVALTAFMATFDTVFLNSHILGNDVALLGAAFPGIRFLFCMAFSEGHPLYFLIVKCVWLSWGFLVGAFDVWWFARVVAPVALLTNVLHTLWTAKGKVEVGARIWLIRYTQGRT
jgi:hypothetical protein